MKIQPFQTIKSFNEFKYKEKGSIFIGQAFPSEDEISTHSILEDIKKKYYDATHHCYAYDLLDGLFKYSDAGEPNGTAGIRIFNAIQHFKLLNILVIVIRYFGGTKLGVGPLGKAYYQTAFSVLENSQKIEKIPYRNIAITADYSASNIIYKTLSHAESKIINTKSKENLIVECQIKYVEIDNIKNQLTNLLGGKIKFEENQVIFL